MRGRRAELAEVARRRHDSAAEMMHPETVGQHATDQRMLAVRQMFGERQSPAAGRRRRILGGEWRGRHHGEIAGRQFLFGEIRVAPLVQLRHGQVAGNFREATDKILDGLGRAKRLDLFRFLLQVGGGGAVVQVKRAGVDVHAREFLDQLLLLGGAFRGRRVAGDTSGIDAVRRNPSQLAIGGALDVLKLLRESLAFHPLRFGFDLGRASTVGVGGERDEPLGWRPPTFPIHRGLEDRPHPKIVRLRNRIVAMIVALSATDRHPQQRRGHHLDRFRDHRVAGFLGRHSRRRSVRHRAEKPSRDQPLAIVIRQIRVGQRHQFVPRQLLDDERIQRAVAIERPDHIVAILVSVRTNRIGLGVAFGIGIASGVEPMAAPAFAIPRRRQEAIDGPRPCVRGAVARGSASGRLASG